MEGVRSLDEVYAFYRHDDSTAHCRSTMLQFLDSVADVLRSKPLYYSTSLSRLGISLFGTWAESSQHPSILISSDDRWIILAYYESWEDGPFYQTREDAIKCPVESARAGLLEMLARLKV